ncbi:PREDICTED: uncharacterized protein LOC105312358 isoform X1 [Amphimedon queenslandica]|uniref:Glycosyltransferase family 92 protein n=1 Tax=Amphimedon queenslandica TaxID=400682 RepID=A0AAN0IL01_AMPQE|nr:PREDICTED: uncharacterized protein LOC105312358 isoform X1 [Amphimedon queenslandica]|eukprot:XP_011403244.2 PREDICTED: uncharacterized protein LOC105312358 isoform X1 [Amphimedon queenslandica]
MQLKKAALLLFVVFVCIIVSYLCFFRNVDNEVENEELEDNRKSSQNVRKKSKAYPLNSFTMSPGNSILKTPQPNNRPQNHVSNRKQIYHNLFHPANASDLWVTLDNKRLAVRRLAYYDARDPDKPSLILNALYDLRHSRKPRVFVHLKYSNEFSQCLPMKYKTKSGKLDRGMREYYVYFLLSTKESVSEIPESVALSLNKDCNDLSSNIPVQSLEQGPDLINYAVCLHKALFSISDVQVLVDWIELNKALGAELLILYFQTAPENMYTVLKPYIKQGLVEVIDWNLMKPTVPVSYTRDLGQSGVINECIYRNMNRVKYLALTDIDEFIVPESKFEKVGDMVEYLEEKTKSKPVSAYRFHNTYYFEDPVSVPQVKDVSFCPKMKLPRYFRRTQRATHAEKYGSDKLVVKTRAVNVVQVHFVVDKQKEYEAEYEVPNDIGRSNHYRWPYRMADFTPHEYSDIMGRYVATVIPKIKSVMCE